MFVKQKLLFLLYKPQPGLDILKLNISKLYCNAQLGKSKSLFALFVNLNSNLGNPLSPCTMLYLGGQRGDFQKGFSQGSEIWLLREQGPPLVPWEILIPIIILIVEPFQISTWLQLYYSVNICDIRENSDDNLLLLSWLLYTEV